MRPSCQATVLKAATAAAQAVLTSLPTTSILVHSRCEFDGVPFDVPHPYILGQLLFWCRLAGANAMKHS